MIFRPNIFPEEDEKIYEWIMDFQVTDGFSDLSDDPSKSPIMKIEGRDDLSLKALFSSSSFVNRTNTIEELEASSSPENIEERSEHLPTRHNTPVLHNQLPQVDKRPRSASNRSRRSSSKKKTARSEHETRASISGYISRRIRSDSIWLNPILPTPFREAGIVWNGVYKRKPSLVFSPSVMVNRDTFVKILVEKLNMSCKVSKNDCKLLRTLLYSHGLTEMQGYSTEFNLLWTSSHLKPSQLKCLYEFQKINHFPNSFELTRKDRLATNIQRMQILKGFHNFDFVPRTFVLPQDYQDLLSEHMKERSVYIVKPIASSRGRGIYLTTNPDNIPMDDTVIVSKYISNPLLIDGFKFDLRLYVAATSYDPLIVYVYEEGLARFATVRYQFGVRNLKNVCMHLTNYSVNKLNHDFVHNDDADVEDFGNKWSLGALLRYLRSEGKDTAGLMLRIEDIIIKSFIAVESPIVSACHLFQAGKNNCFELYGFDIIVDENLRPWLLEVNLSPSLACDTPLDFKIKSSMIADLLTLAGIQCHDPSRKYHPGVNHSYVNTMVPTFLAPKQPTFFVSARDYLIADVPGSVNPLQKRNRNTPTSGNTKSPAANAQAANSRDSTTASWAAKNASACKDISIEECKFARRLQEENARCGGWLRLFPSPEAWEQYSALFEAAPSFGTTTAVPSWLAASRPPNHPDKRSAVRNPHNAEPMVNSVNTIPQHTVYSRHLRIAIATAAMNRINRTTFINPAAVAGGDETKQGGGPAKCPIHTVHPNLTAPFVNLGLYTGLVDAKRSAEPVPEPRLTINLPPASQVFSTFHAPLHSLPPNILAESLMVVLGYDNPNFTVTRAQARRIAACYVHTLGRLPFYHRKLGSQPVIVRGVCLSVNCDHSKKSDGRYCGIRPIEEDENPVPTVQWSAELPISAQIMSLTPSSSTTSPKSSPFQEEEEAGHTSLPTPEKENYLLQPDSVRKMTKLQARSTFSTYLSRVYDRLVKEENLTEEQTKEAEGQLELMLRFLQKAALNLSPFAVATICCGETVDLNKEVDSLGDFAIAPFGPTSTIEEKRKHLVQVLDTFIRIYMYETALACSKLASDVSAGVDKESFQQFLQEATESELEAALSEYTKFNKSVSLFIGVSQCNSVCRARTRPATSVNPGRKLITPRCGTAGSGGGIRKNPLNQSNHNWPKTSPKTKRTNGKIKSSPLVCREDQPVSDRLVAMPMSQNRKMPKNACFAVCPCPIVNTNNKHMTRRNNENMAFMLVRRDRTPQSRLCMGLDIRNDLGRHPSERIDSSRRTEGQRSAEPVVLATRSRENTRTDKRRTRYTSRSLPLRIKSEQKLTKLPTLMAEPLTSVESPAKEPRASSRQQQQEQSSPSSRILSCPLISTSSITEPSSEVPSSRLGRAWEGSQVQSYRSLGLTSLDSQEERNLLTSASVESVIPGRSLLTDLFPYLPNIQSYSLIDLS